MIFKDSEMAQFLARDKIPTEDVPQETKVFGESIIISKLRAGGLPVNLWLDDTSTPALVRNIAAMYSAGVHYNAVFSEEDATSRAYGTRLQLIAIGIADQIINGSMLLEGDNIPVAPDFAAGGLVTEPVFTMAQVF